MSSCRGLVLAAWAFSFARGGLYYDAPYVVELSGKFTWEHDPATEHCPVLIEYYANWCGHCRAYVDTYMELARRIETAPDLYAYIVSAVDCASFAEFCSQPRTVADRIQGFPTLREFPRGRDGRFVELQDRESHDIELMWQNLVKANERAIAHIGQDAARACATARPRLQALNKKPAAHVIRHIPTPGQIWLQDERRALYQAIVEEPIRVGALSSPRTSLPKLQAFVAFAVKGFPDVVVRQRLATEVAPWLESLTGGEDAAEAWRDTTAWLRPPDEERAKDYFGCRGSLPNRRGFTCALWQLFHAMLANARSAREKAASQVPHEGVAAIHGWVDAFFGCQECREHFLAMAHNMTWQSVEGDDAALLWLWRAHNVVNERLKGELMEDPMWPKLQFPAAETCAPCRQSETNTFVESEVLLYLRRLYAEGALVADTKSDIDFLDTSPVNDGLVFGFMALGFVAMLAIMLVLFLAYVWWSGSAATAESEHSTSDSVELASLKLFAP